MPISPAQLQAEFAEYLDRTRFDVREQWRHQLWVALGMACCLVVLWSHFTVASVGTHAPFFARNLTLTISLANLTLCTLLISWSQDVQFRQLRRPGGSVAGRAARVSTYLRQRDLLLLLVAAMGQAVAWLAGRMGVHLLSIDLPLVLVNLLPTAQQIWFGWVEVPNRKRLFFLYKLIALHEARAAWQNHNGHTHC